MSLVKLMGHIATPEYPTFLRFILRKWMRPGSWVLLTTSLAQLPHLQQYIMGCKKFREQEAKPISAKSANGPKLLRTNQNERGFFTATEF
jgi:hypothetical protein